MTQSFVLGSCLLHDGLDYYGFCSTVNSFLNDPEVTLLISYIVQYLKIGYIHRCDIVDSRLCSDNQTTPLGASVS